MRSGVNDGKWNLEFEVPAEDLVGYDFGLEEMDGYELPQIGVVEAHLGRPVFSTVRFSIW